MFLPIIIIIIIIIMWFQTRHETLQLPTLPTSPTISFMSGIPLYYVLNNSSCTPPNTTFIARQNHATATLATCFRAAIRSKSTSLELVYSY